MLRKIPDVGGLCVSPDGTLFAAGKRGRVTEINIETGASGIHGFPIVVAPSCITSYFYVWLLFILTAP